MPHDPLDIRVLNARAVRYSAELVAETTEEDLGRPSTCEGWTLADLLAHMTAQHRGFAAAAAGNGGDLSRWKVRPIVSRDGAVADYEFASDLVQAAFAPDSVLTRSFLLPDFGPDPSSPPAFAGKAAVGFHFIDYLIHGWDVARTLGIPFEPDPVLLEPALAIARAIPNGEKRLRDGAAFAPGKDGALSDESLSTLDQVLLHLGRSPNWPASG